MLPEKQGGTERVLPERLARPISQACTSIAVQPAVKMLGPRPAHLQQMLQKFRASRTSRALTREFLTRNNNLKIKIAHKINFVFSSPVHQGAVTSLSMAGDSSPCLSVYGLISVKMANGLRVLG